MQFAVSCLVNQQNSCLNIAYFGKNWSELPILKLLIRKCCNDLLYTHIDIYERYEQFAFLVLLEKRKNLLKSLGLTYWSQVENRRIYIISSVHPSVRPSRMDYLRNRSKGFSEISYEVETQQELKHHTTTFSIFCLDNSKVLILQQKCLFEILQKNRYNDFSKILPNYVNKWTYHLAKF